MIKKGNLKYVIMKHIYDVTGKIFSGFVFFAIFLFVLLGTDSDLFFPADKFQETSIILRASFWLLLTVACYVTGFVLQVMGGSKRLEYKALQELKNRYGKSENRINGRIPFLPWFIPGIDLILPVAKNSRDVVQRLDGERKKMMDRLEAIESIDKNVSLSLFRLKTEILSANALRFGIVIIFVFAAFTILLNLKFFHVFYYPKIIALLVIFLSGQLIVRKFWYSYYSDISGVYLLFQFQKLYYKNSN